MIKAKSKEYIIKFMMFLAATARPRYGKIGMYSIVKVEVAKKNSKNRPACTKCVNVTAQVYKHLIFNKVLPDINRKWRGNREMRQFCYNMMELLVTNMLRL